MGERALWLAVILVLLGVLASGRAARSPAPSRSDSAVRPRPQPGVRLTMAELHQQGGVPLGWQMTLPPGDPRAGRQDFIDFGCPSCHRIGGETFAGADLGPDLSGMGSHHPPAYFAEAILNPDAVLIDGPGYVGNDGRSTMPAYPDMATGQLSDIVTYLAAQTQGGMQSSHMMGPLALTVPVNMSMVDLTNRPEPGPGAAHAFFAQTYDVLPGRLAAFESWFAGEGRQRFLELGGLLGIDTFVDAARPRGAVTTLFEFRDEAALRNFMGDPATADLWTRFDAFVGPHGHFAADQPLVYRAPGLSSE